MVNLKRKDDERGREKIHAKFRKSQYHGMVQSFNKNQRFMILHTDELQPCCRVCTHICSGLCLLPEFLPLSVNKTVDTTVKWLLNFKWFFLPSSLYIMDLSAAKNTCSFNWIQSGEGTSKGLNYKWKKKKRSLQWGQFCDSYNPLSQIPHSLKKKVQGFHLPQTPQSSALPNLITQTLLNCKLQHVHSFL